MQKNSNIQYSKLSIPINSKGRMYLEKKSFLRSQYQRDRAKEYPSWQEQMDMQYWDSVNDTTTWKDAIAKVKSDNPKT